MDEVEKLVDQVIVSQNSTTQTGLKVVDYIIDKVGICAEQIKSEQNLGLNQKRKAVQDLCEELSAANSLKKIRSAHKKLHNDISKLGKSIDSTFQCDTSWMQEREPLKSSVLDKPILRHLLRKGYFDVAERFCQESGSLEDYDSDKDAIDTNNGRISAIQVEQYQEMHLVLNALDEKKLKPAVDWVSVHRHKLERISTDAVLLTELEFQLHRAQFVLLSESGKFTEAVEYARKELVRFKDMYTREIQQLMGGLVLLNNNKNKLDELRSITFDRIREVFLDICCSFYDIEKDSYLEVCLQSGEAVLPRLIKYFQVTKQNDSKSDLGAKPPNAKGWKELEELPVEVNLSRNMRYHSTFTCPISREQTSVENPPVLLLCGHVIAKTSTAKIVRSNGRIKCPTCPKEQALTDVRVLYF